MMESSASEPALRLWEPFDNLDRICLAAVSGGCVGLFHGVAHLLRWPTYLKCEASLLASHAPLAGMAVLLTAMALSMLLATLLLGRLRYEAGLFAACIGLAGLANRGGTVSSFLLSAGRPGAYLWLTAETILLLAVVGLSWQLMSQMRRWGWLAPEAPLASNKPSKLLQICLATALQVVVTGVILMIMVQAHSKKQVVASVVIASLIGSLVAHQSLPIQRSAIYWIGPFIVGIVGYLWAWYAPGRLAIGIPANALAAASPMDYASVGTAGAIFGYWMSRQWQEAAIEPEVAEDALD